MRTTIRIDDQLLRRLKERSARTGRTVGELIEDAVREALDRREKASPEVTPLPVYGGTGVLPGVDLTSSGSLVEAMDQDEELDALR